MAVRARAAKAGQPALILELGALQELRTAAWLVRAEAELRAAVVIPTRVQVAAERAELRAETRGQAANQPRPIPAHTPLAVAIRSSSPTTAHSRNRSSGPCVA